MQCVFQSKIPTTDEQLNDLTVVLKFRCKNCEYHHKSKYPPHMIHRQCAKAPPSGVLSRLSRYARAVKRWTEAGKPVRTDEQVEAIFAICQACPHINEARTKCKLCRCKLNIGKNARFNKIRMATERCPANKWLSLFDEAVLLCLSDGLSLGADIYPVVCRGLDVTMTTPAFYDLMADVENAGIVVGFEQPQTIDGVTIMQRCYRPSPGIR